MSKPSSSLIEYIYKMAGAYRDNTSNDAELLSRYAATQDERAFSSLMMRHGVMVWDICNRILRNVEDVEEAYQTTFLVLAQKAKKIRVTETLAGWLHQVAHRTAVAVRRKSVVRQKLSEKLKILPLPDSDHGRQHDQVFEELHGEIAKMPENLRVAVVLHYFEQKTHAEVAGILGVSESTVRYRLNRGEAFLERRLIERSLGVGAATIGSLLEETVSQAAVPPGLIGKTMRAATAFRDGKLTGRLVNLLKDTLRHTPATTPWWKSAWMISILCLGGLGMVAGGIAWIGGYFGTNANDPLVPQKQEAQHEPQNKGPNQSRVDAYGDPLPSAALARLGTARFRNVRTPPLFTRDSKGIVSCMMDGPALLCDAMTGRVLRKFGKDVRGVALSGDSLILVTRSPDDQGGLCIWDSTTGKLLKKMKVGPLTSEVQLAMSPDGAAVVSASPNSDSCAIEIATGNVLWELDSSDLFQSISYTPDGKSLLAFDGRKVRILDARSAISRLGRMGPKELPGRSIAYATSANAQLAAFASTWQIENPDHKKSKYETEVRFWDLRSLKELPHLKISNVKTRFSSAIALSPDGKFLAVIDGNEKLIRLFDVSSGQELGLCQTSQAFFVKSLAFSPNGKFIAANCCDHFDSYNLHLWNVKSEKEITPRYNGHTGVVTSLVFTAGGTELVSGGVDGQFRIWNAATGEERQHGRWLKDSPCITKGVIAPDGRTIAAYLDLEEKIKPAIKIFRREGDDVKEVQELPLPKRGNYYLFFSPDSKLLACTLPTDSDLVYIWDIVKGKALPAIVGALTAFAQDGKTLVSGQDGATISASVRDARTGIELCVVPRGERDKQGRPVADNIGGRGWAFSPDGCILAGVGIDDKIRLWNLPKVYGNANSAARNYLVVENALAYSSSSLYVPLVFSPDGRMFAASDKNCFVRVWETATGLERLRLEGHQNEICSLVFAPDGRRLASGGKDTSILIWDVTGGKLDPEGKVLPCRPSKQEMELLWSHLLVGKNVQQAAHAVWTLVSAGETAVSFLQSKLNLTANTGIEATVVTQLINDLGSPEFQIRKRAVGALAKLGEQCEPDLQEALARKPSAEVRHQIESLFELLEVRRACSLSSEEVAAIRAIEVLGHIATPSAKKVLQRLAAAAPIARQTKAAKFALDRLNQ